MVSTGDSYLRGPKGTGRRVEGAHNVSLPVTPRVGSNRQRNTPGRTSGRGRQWGVLPQGDRSVAREIRGRLRFSVVNRLLLPAITQRLPLISKS